MKDFLAVMAIGDAVAMRLEFVEHDPVTLEDLFYGPHPKFAEYQAGKYTDDTQMSLAHAELLLAADAPSNLQPDDFIRAWLSAFHRDPRVGYGRYMYRSLRSSKSVEDFCGSVDAARGTTSGAAMRVAPIGLLSDVAEVKYLAELQGRITHDTRTGATSALAMALAVHFLHHGGHKSDMADFIVHHLGADWQRQTNEEAADMGNGLTIVKQALNAVMQADSLSGVLVAAVNQGRQIDADTVCAIAMVIASRDPAMAIDLPQHLYDGLENGEYGLSYLQHMDAKLMHRLPPSQQYRQSPGRDRRGPKDVLQM